MRWIGASPDEKTKMLGEIGVESIEHIVADIPKRVDGLLNIPLGLSEQQLLRQISAIASRNQPCSSGKNFLGAGAYEHAIPAVIDSLISRGEFLTAYTPYQPEASQGTLTAIFEFQSMIAEITAMDVANASMYDGPSAVAEAALLAMRHTKREKVVMSGAVHPQWREVAYTYISGLRSPREEIVVDNGVTDLISSQQLVDDDTACLIIQQPNFFGQLENLRELGEIAHAAGALFIVACNPVSLGLIAPPGEVGADIAVGDCQPLGIPFNYGGPYAGFFAVKNDLIRQMPGRIAGMAWDSQGRRGFTLTLQTREQHIRRERATSNICTNQALLALSATIYLSQVGKVGFQSVANHNLQLAHWASSRICTVPGITLAYSGPFFNEFTLKLPIDAYTAVERMREKGFQAGLNLGRLSPDLADCLLVCVTETKTKEDIDRFAEALEEAIQ